MAVWVEMPAVCFSKGAALATKKPEIITFKADGSLLDAMRGIPNRSEFIREAVLAALDHVCPVCRGTGILTPKQQEHWRGFMTDHVLQECEQCHEVHLACSLKMPKAARSAGTCRS